MRRGRGHPLRAAASGLTLAALAVAPVAAPAADESRPWRRDPTFQAIATRLDAVAAVDNHTHLLWAEQFNPALDAMQPLGLRSRRPETLAFLVERYGVPPGTPLTQAVELARAERKRRLERAGEAAFWREHLDATRTDIALVNQGTPAGTDGERLRWVAMASDLLYPLPADSLMARSPDARSSITGLQERLRGWLKEGGLAGGPPADLPAYVGFLEGALERWRRKGAVAVKLLEAYRRTLRFEEVPEERAARLYSEGLGRPLGRDDYLALQDYLARRLFLKAGELKLPVHIHSSHGVPPFLRLHEADVRNLDLVLTDPRFFGTSFVLIHGGAPLVEEAAYLGIKPHVWIDVSAQPFLYPVPDLAANLRKYLLFAPEKVLFGTDPGNYPGVPAGPEVLHAVASRSLREALSLALAGLVRDGVLDPEAAVRLGRGVLRDNALRLYGWTGR